MELYLTMVESGTKKTDVIMQASGPIGPGDFLALDLNATFWADYRALMIAQPDPGAMIGRQSTKHKFNPRLHKVGITMPVQLKKTRETEMGLYTYTWDDTPLEDFTLMLSRASCSGCQMQDNTAPRSDDGLGISMTTV